MRQTVHFIVKDHIREHIIDTRRQNKWTKERMSEKLAMDIRSYADIEKGISACSAVTLILYLVLILTEDQQIQLLRELKKQIVKHWEYTA